MREDAYVLEISMKALENGMARLLVFEPPEVCRGEA